MKKLSIILVFLLVITGATYFWAQQNNSSNPPPVATNSPSNTTATTNQPADIPAETVIAENLDTPWALAVLPDGKLLVTERFGRVTIIDPTGKAQPVVVATLPAVKEIGEGGLLGIALHPDFATNNYVYLYYTYSAIGNDTLNKVVRMTLNGNTLENEVVVVERIPGASNHNGGRIAFGPDKFLYIGTGDAQNPSQAQVTSTLGGKILRVTGEGKAPSDNPFKNLVYSSGHRNVQGLAWDERGNLWATEHGRSGITTGLDELNLIRKGGNYGWPTIEGNAVQVGMIAPVSNSGPNETWAPSGAAFLPAGRQGINNSVYFSGLRGQALYQAQIKDGKVANVKKHLSGTYGRIREVVATADGLLYITTSNRDGRGVIHGGDDKIVRINPATL